MVRVVKILVAGICVLVGMVVWGLWVRPVEAPSLSQQGEQITPTRDSNAVDRVSENPSKPKIIVSYPQSGALVPKAFKLVGRAPGTWFFEASAPVFVQAHDGSKIASGFATAQGEWMTEGLVDFTADIDINPAYTGEATLVVLKDNPSGLPEHEDSFELPIVVQ